MPSKEKHLQSQTPKVSPQTTTGAFYSRIVWSNACDWRHGERGGRRERTKKEKRWSGVGQILREGLPEHARTSSYPPYGYGNLDLRAAWVYGDKVWGPIAWLFFFFLLSGQWSGCSIGRLRGPLVDALRILLDHQAIIVLGSPVLFRKLLYLSLISALVVGFRGSGSLLGQLFNAYRHNFLAFRSV